MADLSVDFLRYKLPTPLILASGIWGTTVSLLERAARNGCGAVTAKSCGPRPRAGHVNPSCLEWGHGLINAIGLANPGVEAEIELLAKAKEKLAPLGVPLIASIFAGTYDEFAEVATLVAQAEPDFVEVNVSCPNVDSEFGEPFAGNAKSAGEVTVHVKRALQDTNISTIIKLSPNVPSIARIADSVIRAGADAVCAINTVPGMLLDVESAQPILANRSGGLSGPAIKPVALKSVYDIRKALPTIPIIGTGGVTDGIDLIEMMMVGANAVGVGSAIYHRGADAIEAILAEADEWLESHNIAAIHQMHDRAHNEPSFIAGGVEVKPSGAPIPQAH